MKTVSVLFARADSVYKTLPSTDVFDLARDAKTYRGGSPTSLATLFRGLGWKTKTNINGIHAREADLWNWYCDGWLDRRADCRCGLLRL